MEINELENIKSLFQSFLDRNKITNGISLSANNGRALATIDLDQVVIYSSFEAEISVKRDTNVHHPLNDKK